ncbi:CGNR zinc finger domain-containing protein [Microbacterium resistens]|uniref:CGNR zinc finger domain-containing protein n=1 Tax=Microbacterium TaxID=33882 RepID=UPI001C59F167|nr:CGNR zinc finger domain-containing protein [Microbacterium resistens]MBW1637517.1 CGNR zinc finger domain-containing protein [Microbacterium resistens]
MEAPIRFGSTRWALLAVALVNTAANARHGDQLERPEQLRDFLLSHNEPEPVSIDARDLADARAARSEFAAVFVADNEILLAERLNAMLTQYTAPPRLVLLPNQPLHVHIDRPDSSWGEWLAASGAMALSLLIAEQGPGILGTCSASDCGHALLRFGPGPPRRFCEERCASRTRVAAHRRNRHRTDAQPKA